MILGILAAFASSMLRAGLNVLDRLAFGHRHAEVFLLNLVNNFLPLLFIFPVAAILNFEQVATAFVDVRNLWLAGLVQLVAYAFSVAFRKLTIPQVIVYSKLPDLFIPLGIYGLSGYFSTVDFFFSTLTTLVCFPVLFQARRHWVAKERSQFGALIFLMGAVFLRGVLSGKLIQEQGASSNIWLAITTATLWWRFVWTLILTGCLTIVRGKPRWVSPGKLIVFSRAVITLAVQGLYVFALAAGPIVAVWPIINSTSLFATVLSAIMLRERPNKYEILAVGGIVTLTLVRMFWPSMR